MQRYTLTVFVITLSMCALLPPSWADQADEETLVEMHIKGVAIDPDSNAPIVVLEDTQGNRAFPIWIGVAEARAIALEMEGITTPRPLTHALLRNVLNDLHVQVTRIVINDLRHNTFYAAIHLQQERKTFTVDARPSDAIALALQMEAPIFVAHKVLDSVRTVTLEEEPASPPPSTFGMHVQSLDAMLAHVFHVPNAAGVLVASVESGSVAARHGMQRGDVITGVDGQTIKDMKEFLALCQAKQAGQHLVLQVTRDRQALELRLLLSSLD